MKFEISRPTSAASSASAATPSDKTTSLPRASVKALPNGRIEVLIDGVKYTGAELIDGKRIQLKKKIKISFSSSMANPSPKSTIFTAPKAPRSTVKAGSSHRRTD